MTEGLQKIRDKIKQITKEELPANVVNDKAYFAGWIAGLAKAELLYEQSIDRLKILHELEPKEKRWVEELRTSKIAYMSRINWEIGKLKGKTDAFNTGIREALEWSKTVI